MIYNSYIMENQALSRVAAEMCVAARTAPKARGIDYIHTLFLTGADKDNLERKMREISQRKESEIGPWYKRDADNLHCAHGVVLIGAKRRTVRGLKECGYCGHGTCAECLKSGGCCSFIPLDLGIAIGSALCVCTNAKIDSRVMMSVGKAAEEMSYINEDIMWIAIPMSVSGKNIFFDR